MDGEKRRYNILENLKQTSIPLSGSLLADAYGVSRQVIVQDIALLRAQKHDILSTNSGYILKIPSRPQRLFYVVHDDESILDELFTIVDLGGHIIDVQIQHPAYGNFAAMLNVRSRKDAEKLMESISSGRSRPLKNLTQNRHCHLVEAETEEDLDIIESELRRKGYLCG
ncbi:MAG: transcription repressor NadR [Synergistaceae bacterium]|nr:transcription repressor NadR [Synergistaceae bacterium]